MALTAQRFIEQLSSVSLLAQGDLDTIREKLSEEQLKGDAEQLAKELVRTGRLTKFQAVALYQGKGKGLVFGEYVVLDKLGAGGMGQVYKARHRRMKRMAAIKVLPPHVTKDPQTVRRFYQEVEMAAKLNHPNIVQSYDAAEANGLHYLVMEYVDGRDLSSILAKQGPLNVEQVMNCIRQAAEGLAYAHNQAVVHRDVKPGNLLVDKSGVVKILDMGLARTVDALESQDKHANEELTQAGQVMGTVDYMAPEQARDARTADHRADIYSLGCTLYRLLTGYTPFPADTMVKKLMAHATQPIPSLKQHCPEVPPRLEELYQRMMQKNPQDRIGSAKEVADALQKLLSGASEERSSVSVLDDPQQADEWQSFLKSGGSSVSSSISTIGKAAGSSIGKASGSMIGKQAAATSGESAAAATKRPKTALYGGIAAAAVVLLAVGGWLLTRDKPESEPPLAAVLLPTTKTPPQVAPSATAVPVAMAAPTPIAMPIATPPATAAAAATAAAFNLPTTPTPTPTATPLPTFPTATPSATASLFGINLLPTPAAMPTAVPSATPTAAAVATTKTPAGPTPPPESGENQALSFDGTTARVAVPTLKPPSSGIMTWEASVWPGEPFSLNGTTAGILGDRHTGSPAGGTSIVLERNKIQFHMQRMIDGKNTASTLAASASFRPQYRLRIAAVFDRDEWRLFVEGVLVARQSVSGQAVANDRKGETFMLAESGGTAAIHYSPFRGLIDEVRISSVARYAEKYEPLERFESDEHTVALYHFNEGTGSVLGDASGNGHHGTIEGAQWVKAPPTDPRLVPPDSSALIKALAEVDKVIQPDVAKAKTPLDKGALAQRLLTDSSDAAKPGETQFALTQRALDFAVEAGDRTVIDQVLAAHELRFQGSTEERLADSLTAAAKKTLAPPVWQTLATLALERWQRSYADDEFALLRNYADAATVIARKANNPALNKAAAEVTKRMGVLKPAIDAAIAAQEKLAADKTDAEANLALGRYLCFDKEDWLPGLEHFAKGDDEALRALAEQSIAAGDDLTKLIAEADAWYDAGQKATGKTKSQYQSAALFWYIETYNRLTGTERTRIEQRLTQLGAKTRAPSLTQISRERVAAEWVLSHGGTVSYVTPDSRTEQTTKELSTLPGGPFWLTSVIVAHNEPLSQQDLDRFIVLKAIQRLSLNYPLPDGGYERLGWLTTLTRLDLQGAATDDDLKKLLTLQSLTTLNSSNNSKLTDSSMKILAQFPLLTHLAIGYSSSPCYYGDGGMTDLVNLKNLQSLNLQRSNLTDVGLKQLQKLTKLNELFIQLTKATPVGVQEFKKTLPKCSVNGP